jgi:tetratricopeptide (TPR) repeat protein
MVKLGKAVSRSDPARAEQLYETALSIHERTFGAEQPHAAIVHNNLGSLLARRGERTKARARFERASAIRAKTIGADHPDNAATYANLAKLSVEDGQPEAADPMLDRAIEVLERAYGPEYDELIDMQVLKGTLLVNRGRYRDALPLLEGAVNRLEAKDAPLTALAHPLYVLSAALWEAGQRRRAIQLAERSRAGYVALGDPSWVEHLEAALRDMRGQ